MKAKTIKAVIRKKVDEWLASIEDADLREQVKTKVIVTGGCIASMLLREKVNDFDVYFRDRDAAVKVARYYVDRFRVKNKRGVPCKISVDTSEDRVRVVIKSAGIASEEGSEREYEYFEARPDDDPAADLYVGEVMRDPGDVEDAREETAEAARAAADEGAPYRPIFMSTNAITLSKRLQLILRFHGEPDEIHSSYDFAHCTNYWTSWGGAGYAGELVLRPAALEALLTKELRYVGSKYPLCSLIRVRKFVGRGWSINAGQVVKMAMQLSELDLKDPKVLEDQLTGVDVAYFAELIAKVKEQDPDKVKVNAAYLIEIIDRMF